MISSGLKLERISCLLELLCQHCEGNFVNNLHCTPRIRGLVVHNYSIGIARLLIVQHSTYDFFVSQGCLDSIAKAIMLMNHNAHLDMETFFTTHRYAVDVPLFELHFLRFHSTSTNANNKRMHREPMILMHVTLAMSKSVKHVNLPPSAAFGELFELSLDSSLA